MLKKNPQSFIHFPTLETKWNPDLESFVLVLYAWKCILPVGWRGWEWGVRTGPLPLRSRFLLPRPFSSICKNVSLPYHKLASEVRLKWKSKSTLEEQRSFTTTACVYPWQEWVGRWDMQLKEELTSVCVCVCVNDLYMYSKSYLHFSCWLYLSLPFLWPSRVTA